MATKTRSPRPAADDDRKPARPRAVGHRYAAACFADPARGGIDDLFVVGVRYDEDAPDAGESLVARLRAGRLEALARLEGVGRAVVAHDGAPHVLTTDGRLLRSDGGSDVVVADGVVDVAAYGAGALMLAADGVVLPIGGDALGQVAGGQRLASDGARVVVATADAVVDLDGSVALAVGGGNAVAIAGPRVAIANASGVHLVRSGAAVQALGVAHGAHSVAFFGGSLYVGSRAGGLFVVDAPDNATLRSLRPSLRARTLQAGGRGLVVAADLFVAASDDGADFVTRDLGSLLRSFDKAG